MKSIPRFLVVDDDPVNNMLCQFGIRRVFKDAEIKMFIEPEEALTLILDEFSQPSKTAATILFLDINMPSMTGWEFLEFLKKHESYIKEHFKIFIVSSSVDQRDKERAATTELVSGFLSKPVKAENIKQIIEQLNA